MEREPPFGTLRAGSSYGGERMTRREKDELRMTRMGKEKRKRIEALKPNGGTRFAQPLP